MRGCLQVARLRFSIGIVWIYEYPDYSGAGDQFVQCREVLFP
jgi:hypothetical protein